MKTDIPKFRTAILTGGESRRFGSDKALAKINGKTFIEQIIGTVSVLGMDPVLVANSTQDYSFLNCKVLVDVFPDKGPIGGVYTALSEDSESSWLVLTCDMPYLTTAVLENLIKNHQSHHEVSLYQLEENRYQPFPGVYAASLSPQIEERIHSGQLSMQGLLEDISSLQLLKSQELARVFRNINQREE